MKSRSTVFILSALCFVIYGRVCIFNFIAANVRFNFTDNTAFFRACGKAAKLRRDATAAKQRVQPAEASAIPDSAISDSSDAQTPLLNVADDASTSPLPPPAVPSANFTLYAAHARQICAHIRELADLVLARRRSYLMSSVSVYGNVNVLSKADRREFDADSDVAMRQCAKLVRNLETQVDNDRTLRKSDEHPHIKAITLLLNVYLKNVCRIVTELRAIYLKKTQNMNRLCQLGNLVSLYGAKIDSLRADDANRRRLANAEHATLDAQHKSLDAMPMNIAASATSVKKEEEEDATEATATAAAAVAAEEDEKRGDRGDDDEQSQMQLVTENKQLYERLLHTNSELERIESQFSELQRLQATFAEKVVEQEKDIEVIHTRTIVTLDNLDQANSFIREAIKNSASRRVIALFCLIVLTFTLLFLDWYNP